MENVEIEDDDVMQNILDEFHAAGNLTTGALINRTGRSRPTITKRLDKLRWGGYIEYVDGGENTSLYRLVDDPREEYSVTHQSSSDTADSSGES